MKKVILLEVGDIVYNPKYNGLHEIREINKRAVVLSDCCEYLNDTKTVITNKKVKINYLKRLKPVYKKLNKHKFMEWCSDVGSWRTKCKRGDKAYLFYRDNNVIKSWYHEN